MTEVVGGFQLEKVVGDARDTFSFKQAVRADGQQGAYHQLQ